MISPDTCLDDITGSDIVFCAGLIGGPPSVKVLVSGAVPGCIYLIFDPNVESLIEAMSDQLRAEFVDPEFYDQLTRLGYETLASAYEARARKAVALKYQNGISGEFQLDNGIAIFVESRQGETVKDWVDRVGGVVMDSLANVDSWDIIKFFE
jgi:hypothetical protein